ncbi:MAG: hypothetical protein V1837_03740 [Candidatus Woesearchaeota archaeon]
MITPVRNIVRSDGKTFVIKGPVHKAFPNDWILATGDIDDKSYVFFPEDPGPVPSVYTMEDRHTITLHKRSTEAKKLYSLLAFEWQKYVADLDDRLSNLFIETKELIEHGDVFVAEEELDYIQHKLQINRTVVERLLKDRDYDVSPLQAALRNAYTKGVEFYIGMAIKYAPKFGRDALEHFCNCAIVCAQKSNLEQKVYDIQKVWTEHLPVAQNADIRNEVEQLQTGRILHMLSMWPSIPSA